MRQSQRKAWAVSFCCCASSVYGKSVIKRCIRVIYACQCNMALPQQPATANFDSKANKWRSCLTWVLGCAVIARLRIDILSTSGRVVQTKPAKNEMFEQKCNERKRFCYFQTPRAFSKRLKVITCNKSNDKTFRFPPFDCATLLSQLRCTQQLHFTAILCSSVIFVKNGKLRFWVTIAASFWLMLCVQAQLCWI